MAAQRRKKTTRRSGASRPASAGSRALAWFTTGLICGLGLAVAIFLGGYLPERPETPQAAPANQAPASEPALIEEGDEIAGRQKESQFEFFTVLPEMEVVVPDQELAGGAAPAGPTADDNGSQVYILQVGSFRNARDAEQMKARLALLGTVASIQVVTVNEETWHRVRVGPVEGVRKADELRRTLLEHNFDTLVMKGNH